jgi:hypothetical protein
VALFMLALLEQGRPLRLNPSLSDNVVYRCDRMTQFHSAAIGQSQKTLIRLSLLTSYLATVAEEDLRPGLYGLFEVYILT